MEGLGCGERRVFGGEEEGGVVEAEGRLGGDGFYGLFVPRYSFIAEFLGRVLDWEWEREKQRKWKGGNERRGMRC